MSQHPKDELLKRADEWLADNPRGYGQPVDIVESLRAALREQQPQAPSVAPPNPCWLIERGPAQHQLPHVWFTDKNEWTEDANKAKRFATKEAAEAYAEERHWSKPSDVKALGKSYCVTEHSFGLASPQAPAADAVVEQLQRDLLECRRTGKPGELLRITERAIAALRSRSAATEKPNG